LLMLLFLAFHRATHSKFSSALLLLLAWIAIQPNVTPRPHVFGWILACIIFGYLWASSQRNRLVDLITLLLVVVLWVNLHSSAILVPIAAAMSAVEALIYRRLEAVLLWLVRAAVAVAALSISPAGLRLFSYARLTAQINVHSVEWQPLFSAGTRAMFPWLIALFILLSGAIVWIAFRRLRERELIFPGPFVSLAFLILAFMYRRMIAFAFIPLLMTAFELGRCALLPRLNMRSSIVVGLNIVLTLATLWIGLRNLPHYLDSRNLVDGIYPERATDFLASTKLAGHMVNPPDWGGYLSWRLYPRYRTFADGRWDLIGERTLSDGVSLLMHKKNPQLLQKYSADFLIQRTEQFANTPALPPADWALAWIDPVSIILLRKSEQFETNRDRVCEWEASHPEMREHFSWPFSLPPKTNLPTLQCE
jgi:hypothetical protein